MTEAPRRRLLPSWVAAAGMRRWVRAAAIAALSVGMFALGAIVHKSGNIGRTLDAARNYAALPVWNYARALTAERPRLVIDIKHKHWLKLAHNREVALRRGRLLPDARDEVPATVRFDGRELPVKLRLKGDLPDHWRDEHQWSFRIRVRGEETILGMKRFSIQHPRTRDYLNDWFLHRFLSWRGLTALRYSFAEVTVNGRNLGVYAVEEHFEKRLVEHSRQREGVLFRADTDFYWYERPGIAEETYGTALRAYEPARVEAEPALTAQFETARTLFEEFRRGERATHQVFDARKFAELFATLDLVGHHHAAALDNLVFYFNPVTARIEPVAADNQHVGPLHDLAGAGRRLRETGGSMPEAGGPAVGRPADWPELLFADPVFYAEYVGVLEEISAEETLDRFLAEQADEFDRSLRILHKSFPWYRFEPTLRVIRANQERIRHHLEPVRSLHAYFEGYDPATRRLRLELHSIHALSQQAVAAVAGAGMRAPVAAEASAGLPSWDPSRPLEARHLEFAWPESLVWHDSLARELVVRHRLHGGNTIFETPVLPWHDRVPGRLARDAPRARPNFERFPFVRRVPGGSSLVLRPGRWTIREDLVIPAGASLEAPPGVVLDLVGGAAIVSRAPLSFRGSEERPVVLRSSDGTGQGLVVLEAGAQSLLRHVRFEGLANPARPGWELTGAVTFFESPVTFEDCVFAGNRSEDALNLIRTRFRLEGCLFENTASDALDVDFGEGALVATSFVDCGNDGLDVSGSVIEAEALFVNGAGDKGVSVGEQSRLYGRGVTVARAEIALASKDSSVLEIDDLEIRESRVGFAAYRKKPEFGSGAIEVRGARLAGVERRSLVERGSRLTVNGEAAVADQERVEEMLYGVEYGKSSR